MVPGLREQMAAFAVSDERLDVARLALTMGM